MGELRRHLRLPPHAAAAVGRAIDRPRPAQPMAVGHCRRVHLPVPGLLPLALAAQDQDGGRARPAARERPALLPRHRPPHAAKGRRALGRARRARRRRLMLRRGCGARGQGGGGRRAAKGRGGRRVRRVQPLPDARLLCARRPAARARSALRLQVRAPVRGGDRRLEAGPLHARDGVPHRRVLLPGLGLPDEQALRRRQPRPLLVPRLPAAHARLPFAFLAVRLDAEEERADVWRARAVPMPVPAARR
mmetsp:Transcript_4943/g.15397  ORF Transcript_4943/g.15397 Transcript_4943/m.15397 type:complete len:248 (-) Transcript_4943:1463-2206(-)